MTIILEKQVSLTFSLKYLSNFAKSAPLAREVSLNMSNDVPLLVQFDFQQGTLQFFLAPKVRSPSASHSDDSNVELYGTNRSRMSNIALCGFGAGAGGDCFAGLIYACVHALLHQS